MAASGSHLSNSRRRFNVNDVLSILETEDFMEATVYITPPGNGDMSEEDSGDENEGGEPNNICKNQRLAEAEAEIVDHSGILRILSEAPEPVTTSPVEAPCDRPAQQPAAAARDRLAQQPALPRQLHAGIVLRNRQEGLQRPRNWRNEDLPGNLRTQRAVPPLPDPLFLHQDLDPVELFECFIDDAVVDYLVDQTNTYANRDHGNHAFTTNRDDMRTFLGILLLSGYNVLPLRHMYWERSTDCHNEAVSRSMSRNRFDDHMRYIHLADNNNLPPGKLAKVCNFLAMVNEKCLMYFPIQKNLSVDESMIPYFGRHSSKQFIRGKPVRFGFKLWCLADPLGYTVQFQPYAGAGDGQRYGELGLGGTVAKDLISELPHLPGYPYHITFDNYFTSLPLLNDLATSGFGATGTIRKNRIQQCPLRNIERDPRGSLDFRHDIRDNILVLQWNDNNVVTMATDCIEPVGNARRWSRQQGQFIQIAQPDTIKIYNATMGGVDRADQNVGAYRISMRTKKWWWPFFSHTVNLMVQNAWLLYRRTDRYAASPLDLLAFRRTVAQAYLLRNAGALVSVRAAQMLAFTPLVPEHIRKDRIGHYSVNVATQRRCPQCHKNTRKLCGKCRVGLHVHFQQIPWVSIGCTCFVCFKTRIRCWLERSSVELSSDFFLFVSTNYTGVLFEG